MPEKLYKQGVIKMNTEKKMRFSEYVSSFIRKVTVLFSVIVFIFALIGVLIGENTVAVSALPCSMLLWTALFSFLLSVSGLICDILKKTKLNSVIINSVHFVLSYLSYLAVYVFGNGAAAYLNETAVTNFAFKIIVMTLIFIGIYVVVWAIKFVFASVVKKIENKNKNYESIYTDKQ